MVEGLKFLMTSDELRTHLCERIEHHRTRKHFYETKAAELEHGKTEGMNYTNGDPVRNLREQGEKHDQQIKLFAWMHNHVAAGEEYQLDEKDLIRLEILGRGW